MDIVKRIFLQLYNVLPEQFSAVFGAENRFRGHKINILTAKITF